jgi:succinyl-CoA synthetase beta subunit
MKLLECQAHELFLKFGLPASRGVIISSPNELKSVIGKLVYPVVLKAQVKTGGRGKAGGIRIARSQSDLLAMGNEVFHLAIQGFPVEKIFLTNFVDAAKELYLSLTLDRRTKLPVMLFSAEGGTDVNVAAETNPAKIVQTLIDPFQGVQPFMVQYMLDVAGIEAKYSSQFSDIVQRLYTLFIKCDCLLAEINPLAIDSKGTFRALDAKVEIDDNALARHPEFKAAQNEFAENAFVLNARERHFLYIPVEAEGSVGIISNGSGLIMSTIDLLSKEGLKVACALDLGGGATSEGVKEAIQILFLNSWVKLVFVNIFGGITRCDEIALGVKLALDMNPHRIIIVRMEGTNKENGRLILARLAEKVEIVPDLTAGVRRIREKVAL